MLSQKEDICNLTIQLESYDALIAERNELQELRKHLEQWKENILNEKKKAFDELLITFKHQSEKLKNVATKESKWQINYNELQHLNNCLNDKLKFLKSNEIQLQSNLAESENNKKCIQKELCYTKVNNSFT